MLINRGGNKRDIFQNFSINYNFTKGRNVRNKKKKNNKSFLKKKSTISKILKRSMLFNSIAATTPAPSPLPREDRSGIHTRGIQNATFPIGAKLKSAREKSRAIVASLFVISIARGEVRVIRASFRPSRSREIYYGVR